MDDGYLFFSINPVEVAVENDSVDVEMRIYEGEQATISKVILTGNTRTSDHVVLREIRTLPGQKFSRSDLIRTQRELATLGYFDPEQIGIQPKPNVSNGTVDIHYKVVEKPSDQVELSGGWGGIFGFVGTLGLVFNNFSVRKVPNIKSWSPLPQGDGQKLAIRFQANGRRFQTYSFTFTEPWLGGKKPNNFSFNVQHSVQRLIQGFTNISTGSLQVTGVTLTLGRRLTFPDDFFTLSNSLSYLRYQLQNYPGLFRTVRSGEFNNFVFNTTIARNSIDNPIFPRSGSNMVLSIGLTPPYSVINNRDYSLLSDDKRFRWIEYHKWMFDNWWYLNLWKNLVVCARAHVGYIGSYRATTGISPFERFILGGDGMMFNNFLLGTDIVGLRGYTNQSIRPERVEGGVVFNKFVLEMRYPLTLSQAASIYALVFAEGGNNWGSARDVNPFDLKKSVGAGVRIFMPAIGMLGIDYGWGFDPIPGNPQANYGQFHFTIGQMLR
jgi:outer membrane protein insertion porin family